MGEILKGISLKNWSWIHTRASLARAVFSFKTFFVVKWKKWKVKVKSEKKWCFFWSLNFFNLRYIKGGVMGKDRIVVKKCRTAFLWVLNFVQVGGRQFFFKITLLRWLFEKWSQSNFWVFKISGTFICFRRCLNLNCYIGKKVQKNFLMGLKIWWSWGSRFFFSKSP